ncbi:MAG: hypothetical protein V1717_00490 [Candidatus Micrarchaeota archaeon]
MTFVSNWVWSKSVSDEVATLTEKTPDYFAEFKGLQPSSNVEINVVGRGITEIICKEAYATITAVEPSYSCSASLQPPSASQPPASTKATLVFSHAPDPASVFVECVAGQRATVTQVNPTTFEATCSYLTQGSFLIKSGGNIPSKQPPAVACNDVTFAVGGTPTIGSPTPGPYCGNDIREDGEFCDPDSDCAPLRCNYLCTACFDPGTPSGSILRIEGNKVVTGTSVTSADVIILYNDARTGLAATSATSGTISVFVDDTYRGPATYTGTPGVFNFTLDRASLDLQSDELPEGPFVVRAEVTGSDGNPYEANAPQAVLVVKQQKALPETDFFVIALFVLLALFLMRTQSRGKARKK